MYKKLLLASTLMFLPLSVTQKIQENHFNEQLKHIIKEEQKPCFIEVYEENKETWNEKYPDLENKLTKIKQKLITQRHEEEQVKKLLRNAEIDERVTNFFRRNILKSADTGEITFEEFSQRINLDWFVNNAHSFAEEYHETLLETEKKDGVDYRYVVGILGIETRFGTMENLGEHNLVNSLVTQYATTNRKRFAIRELNHTLKLSKKYNEDLTDIKGSYAGAIGVGQWIPSSITNYSKINNIDDLFTVEGIIPSVSNYLKVHGWDSRGNGQELTENTQNFKAVRAYNHSDTYVKIVNEIANGVRRNELSPTKK